MKTKIKICGITNVEDAMDAVELGSDAVGFIFAESSPRFISPDLAQKIINELPPFVTPVGVFADAQYVDILRVIERTGISCVQLQGNYSSNDISKIKVPAIKAFRVDSNFDVTILQKYSASAFLLDTYVEGALGGTGKTFDWNLAVSAKAFGKIILAGGLNSENIIQAVKTAQPYAVDVNSGVESKPGKKDKQKLKRFFNNLQQFEFDSMQNKETIK